MFDISGDDIHEGRGYLHKLFHDPVFASGRVMFTTVDSLFTTADLTLALGDFELAVENVLGPDAGLIPPTRRSKGLLLHDFLDNGLNRKRGLGNLLEDGRTWRANLRSRCGGNDASGGPSEEFGFTTGDLCLAYSNIALPCKERLSTLWRDDSPEALILGLLPTWCSGVDTI